jgi:type IV pilus assembly protein PilA
MEKTEGQQETARGVQNHFLRKHWLKLVILVVVIILILSFLQLSTLDGPNGRRRANEAVAVGKLRRIVALQNDYAASHTAKGFACRLMLLRPAAPAGGEYDADAFLLSENHAGYEIALADCDPGADGVVRSYRITAVPVEPGKSGVRAFCTDETGVLRYDLSGSVERCFALHHIIE